MARFINNGWTPKFENQRYSLAYSKNRKRNLKMRKEHSGFEFLYLEGYDAFKNCIFDDPIGVWDRYKIYVAVENGCQADLDRLDAFESGLPRDWKARLY